MKPRLGDSVVTTGGGEFVVVQVEIDAVRAQPENDCRGHLKVFPIDRLELHTAGIWREVEP